MVRSSYERAKVVECSWYDGIGQTSNLGDRTTMIAPYCWVRIAPEAGPSFTANRNYRPTEIQPILDRFGVKNPQDLEGRTVFLAIGEGSTLADFKPLRQK